MIDFKTKTGKEVGKIKVTELADFIGISEGGYAIDAKRTRKSLRCTTSALFASPTALQPKI